MKKMTVKDIDLKGLKVVMRVDFNVPQDAGGAITDDTRISATIPTVKYILQQGMQRLILMSHLGRPDGKVVANYSLKPVAVRLAQLLGEPVGFVSDCVGETARREANALKERVILLENLRFHAGEEGNDPSFAKELSAWGDVYVNDAFGTAHRAHASTEGITRYLKAVAGFLLEREIEYLGIAVQNPQRPFMIILGGAKVSDKIGVIENLLPNCEEILIGGGMAYTFLKAKGISIGASKLEADKVEVAKGILAQAMQLQKNIWLPIDHVVVDKIDPQAKGVVVGQHVPEGKIAVDIGPKTITLFEERLTDAKTVVWNGPLGIFEIPAFAQGTEAIARFLSTLKATTIIGGGDTAAAVTKCKMSDKMTHLSTGGGASLEFLEGKSLPGVAALSNK